MPKIGNENGWAAITKLLSLSKPATRFRFRCIAPAFLNITKDLLRG